MFIQSRLLVLFGIIAYVANSLESIDNTKVLSRARRHIIFPEGSSLSLAICMTSLIITPFQILSEGINWGVTYDLPNNTDVLRYSNSKAFLQRIYRRDLYQKMESIMNSMGFTGRSCIYRALCEAGKQYADANNNEDGVVETILNTIFTFPERKLMASEPEEHKLYHWAHRVGRIEQDIECTQLYPDCSFSLIDVLLDRYNTNELYDMN